MVWFFSSDKNISLRFEPTGECSCNIRDGYRNFSSKTLIDVESNWDVMPSFGEYTSISRLNRGQQWEVNNEEKIKTLFFGQDWDI